MIQLFIIFHKKIFDECYKDIPQDILSKYFTFIAVNKDIQKEYTPNKYNVINEWELDIYNEDLQKHGYNENSAIYHIYTNKLHTKYNYVGFFQYDMIFNNNIIDYILNSIEGTATCFPISIHDFNFCSYYTWNEPRTLEYIIQNYEVYFNRKFDRTLQYPLFNSYVISNEIYEKIMPWVTQLYDKLYPWCILPPNMTHYGHIAGIYERIMAYAIGNLQLQYKLLDIKHDHNLKKQSY